VKNGIGFDPIQYCSLSDVGLRRSHNQDAQDVILAKSLATWQDQGHVFIVADGMGGHAVGEKASAKAVREIPLNYLKHAPSGAANALRRAFVETNASIYAIGQKNPEFKGLGTTATLLVLRPEEGLVCPCRRQPGLPHPQRRNSAIDVRSQFALGNGPAAKCRAGRTARFAQ
jgi:serine/threonine protein phosphatase PrpC